MKDFLFNYYGYIDLYSSLIIKILFIIFILSSIFYYIYLIFIEKKKKDELQRLKTLNDGIEKIYKTPIKQARKWFDE